MSLHLIAACTEETLGEPIYHVRLILPAGYASDDIAQDLRRNFSRAEDAVALCREALPFRGAPSSREPLTPAEALLLPQIPLQVATLEDLTHLGGEVPAVTITVFDSGRWHRLEGEGLLRPLDEIELFRLKPGT